MFPKKNLPSPLFSKEGNSSPYKGREGGIWFTLVSLGLTC